MPGLRPQLHRKPSPSTLIRLFPLVFDVVKVSAEPFDHFPLESVGHLGFEFLQSEVHDVVMVEFFLSQVLRETQP